MQREHGATVASATALAVNHVAGIAADMGAVTLGLPGVLEHLQSHPEMHVMQGSLSCVIQLAFRQARQLLPAAAHKWACLPAAGV